jgi:hypothetical protein
MSRRPPATVFALGLAGLIPFAATGLGAAATTNPAMSVPAMAGLVAYGAVILSFLGGVHWGFVLAEPDEAVPQRRSYRLLVGVTMSLVGWAAVLTLVLGWPTVAVLILIAGYVLLIGVETELSRRALMPDGYIFLRWILSVLVVLILAGVLVVRLLGGRVLF